MSERKRWTEAEIVTMLVTNDEAVNRAVVAIYNRQTESERSTEATLESNGRGFSAFDARNGSYYARWILSGRKLNGKFLHRARAMMIKYRHQLVEIANSGSEKAESKGSAEGLEA